MKKWKSLSLAIALGAAVAGSIPLISYAASDTPQNNVSNGAGLGIGRTGTPMIDSIAKAIGLTTDEIRAERQAGKSLTEIAAAKGESKDKLLEQMINTRQTQLDALVKEGKLTKDQEDQYLAQMKERMQEMIDRTETGRPDFAPGGGRQGKGMQRGNCTGMMGQ